MIRAGACPKDFGGGGFLTGNLMGNTPANQLSPKDNLLSA